jgi:hypothetical protein
MAILKWKNKKDTRNSVQGPSSQKSVDQLPNIASASPKTTASSSSNTVTTSPTSPSSSNKKNSNDKGQRQSFIPVSVHNPTAADHTQKLQSKTSASGLSSQFSPPNGQQKQQQNPSQPHSGIRSPSGTSTASSVYTNGISSPPAAGLGSNQMQSMIPPPQQQLQQLQQPRFSNNPSGGSQQQPQQQQQQQQPAQQRRLPFTQHTNPNMPQYPWSERTISNASPFPRYGHAANYIAAREGEVFVMGGLKGSNVFGDLWVIETGKHHNTPLYSPFFTFFPPFSNGPQIL